ncbi:hypothetical protein Y11_25851 [Yersinia enterocolitica subsp. palearctica Y11]|uniref:Uncharacterized protein n=2 Tax=Yersinia enterocolitica TaxID=630 RepID=A0A0H3NKH2_YERE1|nr:unknown protein [Yersinia enterocolitica W22703]CBY25596.1 hypothetical protein Y11_25851 [Yersinia enterocolitica subsp. palearctica Y11]CCO69967.1 hypothetical protein D322_3110 [Yersinia enterocolitica IP 10393]
MLVRRSLFGISIEVKSVRLMNMTNEMTDGDATITCHTDLKVE